MIVFVAIYLEPEDRDVVAVCATIDAARKACERHEGWQKHYIWNGYRPTYSFTSQLNGRIYDKPGDFVIMPWEVT